MVVIEAEPTRRVETIRSAVKLPVARVLVAIDYPQVLEGQMDITRLSAVAEDLVGKGPDTLRTVGKLINEESIVDRANYWNQAVKDVDGVEKVITDTGEQVRVWNAQFKSWLLKDGADGDDSLRSSTLQSIGLNRDAIKTTNGFNNDIEAFRAKYLGAKSDIHQFVADIAGGCTNNGVVDLTQLTQRLESVKGITGVFGSTQNVQELVEAYAKAYGVLSQDAAAKQQLPQVVKDAFGIRPPQPDPTPTPESPPPPTLSPEQIADQLINYQTGESTGVNIDLKPSYLQLVGRVKRELERERGAIPSNSPAIVLSPVALEMIRKIAQQGNIRGKEFAMVLEGILVRRNERNDIGVIGFVAPASDFKQPNAIDVVVNEEIRKEQAEKLARQTGLAELLLKTTRSIWGNNVTIAHIHHSGLGNTFFGKFSQGDYAQAAKWVRDHDDKRPYLETVASLGRDGRLVINVMRTYKDDNGQIVHWEHLPCFVVGDDGKFQPVG